MVSVVEDGQFMVQSAWSAVLGDGQYMVLDGQHTVHSGWSVHGEYMVVDDLGIWFVRRHAGCIWDSVLSMVSTWVGDGQMYLKVMVRCT